MKGMMNETMLILSNKGEVELTFSVPVRFFQLFTCNIQQVMLE